MKNRIGVFGDRRSVARKTFWPILFCAVLGAAGCVTHPIDEYNLARAAFEAARDADATRYAPALWFKAEQSYREGQRLYKNRSYDAAKAVFQNARTYAEQAENAARLERHKSGDFIP